MHCRWREFTDAWRVRCKRRSVRAGGRAGVLPGGDSDCRTVGGASSPGDYLLGMAARS